MRLSLFPTLQAPRDARRGIAELGDRIDDASLDDVKTVVSELVTLSILRGASKPIRVDVELVGEEIEAVFDDQGPAARALVGARERRESSLPLRIVEAMVDEWEANRGETSIWFRMRVRRRG